MALQGIFSMKSVILLLLLVSNPSLPNTWAEGEFYLKMSKEINKRIVIKERLKDYLHILTAIK